MKTVVLTVIYPEAIIYFDEYCECIFNQTYKNFDLLLINDGCDLAYVREKFRMFNLKILEPKRNPIKNREYGIKYAFEHEYECLIFCDIDDCFKYTRIQKIIDNIKNADIVAHDLNIVDDSRNTLINDYFSFSINSKTIIDADFIKEKNCLGLSNTAIKLQDKAVVEFPEDVIIGDWYYYTICLRRGLSVKYIAESLTDYRQHSNNLIGIDDFTEELFMKLVKLKINHYLKISDVYPEYVLQLFQTKKLQELSLDDIRKLITKNKKINPHPLWWENVKL